jgi:Tol biopolymer transport system component
MLAMLAVGAAVGWYVWERSTPKAELVQRQLTTNSSELAVRAAAISPDGRYLAYADDSGIHLKVIDTAETHNLSTPAGSRINKLAWFPDGHRLLASGESGQPIVSSLWSISILGGLPQKLRDDGVDGSVFQNGGGIVFVSGEDKEIWQMGPGGEEPTKLITASKGESLATPAMVKGRLWYARGHPANGYVWYDVESRELKGGPPTTLTSDLDYRYTALLVSGGRLIYSRMDHPSLIQGGSLWEIQADLRSGQATSKPRRIADWPEFGITGLSATADGKRLAIVKQQEVTSVYVAELEGNGLSIVNPQRLTLSESINHPYAWTPDSNSVLFDSNRNGTWDVFKHTLDQRTAEKLVASPGGSMRPAMSPDGASVLYLAGATESGYYEPHRIMRVALAGGPPQSLGEIRGEGEIRCARTANICVVSDSDSKQQVLYALDPAKGKGQDPLITGPPRDPTVDSDWDLSPDGSSVAFLRSEEQDGALRIQIRSLAGGASHEINIGKRVPPLAIRWSGDGKGWYVTTWSTSVGPGPKARILLKVDPTGKSQQPIQGSRWSDPIPSPDGRHVAMMGEVLTSNVWMLENF